MLVLNQFIISLDQQLSKYPDEDRHRIRNAIVDDLTQTTDIFNIIEEEEDEEWGVEISPITKEDRITVKQKELNIQPEPVVIKNGPRLRWGRSELHEAVAISDVEAVRRLLSSGVDIEAKDNNGNTPLDFAMLEANDEIVSVFIESGLI